MKTPILCALITAAIPLCADAGTLFYVPIPASGSDAQSGLDSGKMYTSAIAAGTAKSGGRTVNGVTLSALSGAGNTSTAGGVTITAATGTLINGGGKSESIQADGTVADLLSGMIFNDGAADHSEQYVVLDPASLATGKTYDLRVYVCNASGENRQVNLSFAGDGKAAVNTDFFNEDDATTSAGGFAEPNQVYYTNYRFTWDGVSTPGFTATQKFGATPFCLFALTNQEVGGDNDARPAGAVAAMQPDSIAEDAPRRRTTTVETTEDIGVASDVFFTSSSLRNHGRWVTVKPYGRCWQPTGVEPDWEPYTRGHWVYSADGWAWVSEEDFGWATYHYGRWFREEDSGWYWVPGRVWAPSWVSWRHGHSYIGWAPLPPSAIAAAGVGISAWADHRWGIGPRAYNFVRVRDFGAPSMAGVLLPRQENPAVMANTNNVTNIVNTQRGIFSGGPNFLAVNNSLTRAGGEPIQTVRIDRNPASKPVTPDGKFSQLAAGVFAVAAPLVTRAQKPANLPPVAATIAAPKFDKGWNGLSDPKNASALQGKIANEMPGNNAKSAPARLPGMPPPSQAATGTNGQAPLKPFRPGKPTDATFPKPGQPAPPTGATVAKPGQPAPPTSATNPQQPGQPAMPADARPKPGQPTAPTADTGKKRGKAQTTTPPPAQPNQPGNPITAAPTQPGTPMRPGIATPPKAEKSATPADTTLIKPGQATTPPTDGVKKRGKTPNAANIPNPPPGQPPTPPTTATPTPESPRPKKRPGSPANVDPGTNVKPTQPTIPQPDAVRPKPPVKISTPEPSIPKPAPVSKPAPQPAEPVVRQKPQAPQMPAPIARPTPRPAPPVVAPVKPAAPVVPAPTPRPAPPVAAPPRSAPVIPAPPRPPVPQPAPPAKGGKPTPTPTPPVNG